MSLLVSLPLCLGATFLLLRLVRWWTRRHFGDQLHGYFAASLLRMALVLTLCFGLALREVAHRWVLIFAVTAAYFAVVVVDGFRQGKRPREREQH